MAFSPFDSPIYRKLYSDEEIVTLFSDSAEVRAMLLVEGMLAKVLGELGIIPEDSAFFIHHSSMEVQIDPSGLADGVGSSGVPVLALVEAFSKAMEAPNHAQYMHWGATSQDIVDTALMLRLRQYIGIVDKRLEALIAALTAQAKKNRDVVMAARARSQMATPTTFGAKIAGWIAPLERHRERLSESKRRLLMVSIAGTSGNYAVLGERGFEVEEAFATALKLGVPANPWHSARDNLAELASILSLITGSLGKIGSDIILLTQTEIGEVSITGGGSSTMPHKSNLVMPEVLVTMSRHNANLVAQMHAAVNHAQERDGVAWALEWHALPQICIACGVALKQAAKLAENMKANSFKMLANIATTNGQMMAETAMFALAQHMPRSEAQAMVKECSAEASASGKHLREVLESKTNVAINWDYVFNPEKQTGLATKIVDRLK